MASTRSTALGRGKAGGLGCYLAAPLFTDAERAFNAALGRRLGAECPGLSVLLPQEFCAAFDNGPGRKPDFARIYRACLHHLQRASVVVAVLDGADVDSGTAWECGYASSLGIPVVGLRTDWRPAEDGASNCMLARSCASVVRSQAELPVAVLGALGRTRE
jgi:nucleoside 2-deoxyribosyltransferase